VPLAPGEIYYGYGYYGPWSRNISTVNVNTVTNRRYINANVNNSVTVVQRKSFGTGRRIPANIRKNPFLEEKQRPGKDIHIVPPPGKPRQPIMIAPVERGKPVRNITQSPVREHIRPAAPARMQEDVPVKKRNEPNVTIRKPSQPQKKVNQAEGGEKQQVR
jgi:hypothetical protein